MNRRNTPLQHPTASSEARTPQSPTVVSIGRAQRHRRRGAVTVLALSLPALAACQPVNAIVEKLGPSPDTALLELARQADGDVLALKTFPGEKAGLLDTRRSQADQLYGEITRLCGTHPDGSVPTSCRVERQDSVAAAAENNEEVVKNSSSQLLRQADSVPEESRDLVVAQAIDLLALTPTADPDGLEVPELDIREPHKSSVEAARALLDWEYGIVYAADFARALAPSSRVSEVDSAIIKHEQAITQLREFLDQQGQAPAAAPAYQPAGIEFPSDGAGAMNYLDTLQKLSFDFWRAQTVEAAEQAHSGAFGSKEGSPKSQWRDWVAQTAALWAK